MHALAFLTVTAAERGTSAYGQLSRTRQRHDQHVAAGAADLIALTAAEIRRLLASAPCHAALMTITRTGHAGAATTRRAENPTTSDDSTSQPAAAVLEADVTRPAAWTRRVHVMAMLVGWSDHLGALERSSN
jgi:hypothetical protein